MSCHIGIRIGIGIRILINIGISVRIGAIAVFFASNITNTTLTIII